VVTSRSADVAVCTLASRALPDGLREHPRVAVAAPLATANLGIEEIVRSVLARPGVRHLVVCGHDSPLFQPGQSLLALVRHGVGADGSIVGARGHRARLPNLRPPVVTAFRRRVAVHDLRGQTDAPAVLAVIDALPGPADEPDLAAGSSTDDALRDELAASAAPLVRLPTVGRIRPVASTGSGCFVVSLDRAGGRIVLRHYADDLASGHELCHHSATALTLAAVAHGLTSDPAHAGYLGGELAKAETALRLGLNYVQDRPLTRPVETVSSRGVRL
jgi:tetrahydromethanopterin S-methyltransferase subunit A